MDKVIVFLSAEYVSFNKTCKAIHDLGYKIAVIENPNTTNDTSFADYIIFCGLLESEKILIEILRFQLEHEVCAVLSFQDMYIEQAAFVSDMIGLTAAHLKTIKSLKNKYITRIKTERAGIRGPNFFVVTSINELKCKVQSITGYPIIMKPLNHASHSGLIRIDNENELEEKFSEALEKRINSSVVELFSDTTSGYWLAESYMPGFEISVEAYTFNSMTYILAIHDKHLPVEAPFFRETFDVTPSPRISADLEKQIERITSRILCLLGFKAGISHIEYRVHEGHIALLEVNGRPGGGLIRDSVFFSTGLNMNILHIMSRLGIDLFSKPQYRKPVVSHGVCTPRGIFRRAEGLNDVMKNPKIKVAKSYMRVGKSVKIEDTECGAVLLALGDEDDDIDELIELVCSEAKKVTFVME